MKKFSLNTLFVAVVLGGGIMLPKPAAANLPAKTAVKPTAALPATAAGIWQAIDVKSAQLTKTIHSGKLGDVHHQAFAIRDLVNALPARSLDLPTDKQAKVKSGVKFVTTLADRLDASGDANDKAASQANFDKLLAVLKNIRSNYAAPAKK